MTVKGNCQFTGKERDAETGLDYFGARYMSAAQGRFTSPDKPLTDQDPREPQSWNLYAYVTNNPLRYDDPDGRIRRDKVGNPVFTPMGPAGGGRETRSDESGRPVTRRVMFQPGYLEADDGRRIPAYENRPDLGSNKLYQCDCHGLTFADGKYWVQDNDVQGLLEGDSYMAVTKAQAGDVAIFRDGDGNVIHSTTVTQVDKNGKVLATSGLGGVERKSETRSPADTKKKYGAASVTYYRAPQPKKIKEKNIQRSQSFEKEEDQ
jgi:RHS repeat-associated protein